MKSRNISFWIPFILLVSLGVLSIIFSREVSSLIRPFSVAGGMFLVSSVMLLNAKNALKPPKPWGPIDSLKSYYHKNGKPQKYRRICIFWLVIFVFIAVLNFFEGIIGIFKQ